MALMDRKPQGERVVVAMAGVGVQAEMMVEALAAEGIEGFILGETDEGIPVAVGARDEAAAREVLQVRPPDLPGAEAAPTADAFAARAYRWSLRWWWFPPAPTLTLIHLAHAIQAERVRPPVDPKRFRRRVWFAFLVGVVLPVGGMAVLAALALERFL